MAKLTVPERYRNGIAKIINIEDETFEALLSVLEKTEPTVDFEKYKAIITSQLKDTEQEDLIEALLSLYGACAGIDISRSEFAEEVYKAVQESQQEEFRFTSEIGSRFKDRLLKLLNITQIAELIKAAEIQSEYNHVYVEARILSDIRPVFGPDVDATPIGAVVTHNLKICYFKGRQSKEFFVALDNNDIEELITVLNRAKNKAAALQKVLDDCAIRFIEVK